jgi:hypothetical protein
MKRFFLTMALLLSIDAGNTFAMGNLADVTIYDRNEHKSLPIHWHDGKAYVVGRPGNEYQVTLRNRGGAEVLAVISVDGVNVLTGETASAGQSGYLIDTGASLDVKGWRKTLSRTAAFYFTELPDSYAARTGRPDNVGVIGVAFFRRKVEELSIAPKDYYEPQAKRSAPAPAASADNAGKLAQVPRAEEKKEKSLGTGHGRNETSHARYVDFERATASPEEMVTIYYDSRANLLARGVIKAEPWRGPQPFPARFVPDPPARW